MTSIKPILTFLRNAHFLHGFIATVIAFNVIGNGTIWLLVNDPSDLIVMPMMPFCPPVSSRISTMPGGCSSSRCC